jgi:hypothetical protein
MRQMMISGQPRLRIDRLFDALLDIAPHQGERPAVQRSQGEQKLCLRCRR